MKSQYKTTQTVYALKLPILKTGDYDLWSMRIKQYLTHINYALWEVIMNGDAPAIASANTEGPIPPKTAEQKLARKNELKAKTEIKSQSSSSSNSQNVAFVYSYDTSSTNEAVNIVHDVPAARSKGQASSSTYADDVLFSFFANQSNSLQLDNEDLEHIDTDDLEEMDLKWQVAMLT
ncbi:hypothetical protein Tco_0775508, partial [Tanacetum coccineum]